MPARGCIFLRYPDQSNVLAFPYSMKRNVCVGYRNDILHVRQTLGLCASVQENSQPNFLDGDMLNRRGNLNDTFNRDFNHTILVHNTVLCWDCVHTNACIP